MIRFAVIGSGWRSLFYVRAAAAQPQKFELCALLCRGREKAEAISREYGVHTTVDEDEVKSLRPDFVVSAVSKANMFDVCMHWLDMGFAVLSETPISLDAERLREVWRRHAAGQKIQVAEQYFLRPDYSPLIRCVESGKIGQPVSVSISAMHDYHAASMIRRLLCMDIENFAVTGKNFTFPVTNTKTRYEILTDGAVRPCAQAHLILEYSCGKTAFYDFTSEQYRSPIRNRSINVRGTRGETLDGRVYYLGEDNLPRSGAIRARERPKRLGEDETAITELLRGMERYIKTGAEVYPMRFALEDAYTAILMAEAGRNEYKTFRSEKRPWA